jgi:CshA-type fibril repeat protein
MSTVLGKVIVVSGEFIVIGKDGVSRVLNVGDTLYEGDRVEANGGNHIEIQHGQGVFKGGADCNILITRGEEEVQENYSIDEELNELLTPQESIDVELDDKQRSVGAQEGITVESEGFFRGGGGGGGSVAARFVSDTTGYGNISSSHAQTLTSGDDHMGAVRSSSGGGGSAPSSSNTPSPIAPPTQPKIDPAIRLDEISDDYINLAERGSDLEITGSTVGIDFGETITVTFNNKTYSATVDEFGRFKAIVPNVDLLELEDAETYTAVATYKGVTTRGGSDSDGNPYDTEDVTTDFSRPEIDDPDMSGTQIPSGESFTFDATDGADDLDPSSVIITDSDTGSGGKTKTVDGEGVWSVGEDGKITFTPEEGFIENPTPIDYRVSDMAGNESGVSTSSGFFDLTTSLNSGISSVSSSICAKSSATNSSAVKSSLLVPLAISSTLFTASTNSCIAPLLSGSIISSFKKSFILATLSSVTLAIPAPV